MKSKWVPLIVKSLLFVTLVLACSCQGAVESDNYDTSPPAVEVVADSESMPIESCLELTGPLYECPAIVGSCMEGLSLGDECEDGDVLLTECTTCACGNCEATKLFIPRPCCGGYWLFYTIPQKECTGGASSLPICPSGFVAEVSFNCEGYANICSCDEQQSDVPGWYKVISENGNASPFCDEPQLVTGKLLRQTPDVKDPCLWDQMHSAVPVVCEDGSFVPTGDPQGPSTSSESGLDVKRQVHKCIVSKCSLDAPGPEAVYYGAE